MDLTAIQTLLFLCKYNLNEKYILINKIVINKFSTSIHKFILRNWIN